MSKNAYFTVEAALVFPYAIGILLFVVYMLLFQYDRCLLEQDVGMAALWGCYVEAEGTETLKEMIQKHMEDLYQDKYAAWKMEAFEARLEKNCFSVTGRGALTFPAPAWNFWSGKNSWVAEKKCSFRRISATEFVRLCRSARQQEPQGKVQDEMPQNEEAAQ